MRRCLIAAVFVATPLAVALGAAQARATRPAATPRGVELASLDRAADPCVDFYRFACGGWIDAHPLPADRRNYARLNEIRDRNDLVLRRILERPGATGSLRKASDYYAACTNDAAIDARGLAPLRPELARIAAVTDVKALPELIAHLHMTAASNPASGISASSTFPFFQMVARADPSQASRQMVWARPQGTGLPDRDYYTKTDDRSAKLRSDYRAHVAKMLTLAGETAANAESGAGAVLRIETALADARLDAAAARDPKALVHVMTVADLQASTPSFDWKRYVAARSAPAFDRLNNSQPKVIERFERILTDTPLDDIKAYLRWHLIHSAATMLPKAFGDADFEFFGRVLLGQREPQPRWRQCMNQTDEYLGDALGQGFVEETFRPEAKADTLAMIGYLKAALRRDIETADWMSEPTKRAALEKLAVVQDRIGHPDKWRDVSALRISRADAFGNLQRVRAAENARDLGQAGQSVDPTAWPITPQTVNSGYITSQNTILFPAGILQPPVYDAARDAGGQLRCGGIAHRPRADPRLRRCGEAVRCEGKHPRLVDARRRESLRRTRGLHGGRVLAVRRRGRHPHQRQADARREHRRQRRPAPGADGLLCGSGSGRAAGAGRFRGRPARVPRVRASVVSDHHGGIRTGVRGHQPARRQPLPRQRRRLEHAGVPEGVRVQGRRAHGARQRVPRLVIRNRTTR